MAVRNNIWWFIFVHLCSVWGWLHNCHQTCNQQMANTCNLHERLRINLVDMNLSHFIDIPVRMTVVSNMDHYEIHRGIVELKRAFDMTAESNVGITRHGSASGMSKHFRFLLTELSLSLQAFASIRLWCDSHQFIYLIKLTFSFQ